MSNVNLFELKPEETATNKDNSIKLKKVTLQNYRNVAYKEYVIDGNSVLLEGINGLGKTNVLEGIFWALSGNLFNGTAKTESQEVVPYNAEKDIETSVKLEFVNNLFVFERRVSQQWSRDKETYKGLKTILLVNNAVSKNQETALNALRNYLGLSDVSNNYNTIPDLAKINLLEVIYNVNSLKTMDYKTIRAIITDMVGEVDFKVIINNNPDKYGVLVEPLQSHGLDLDALKSNTRSKIFDKNNGLELKVKTAKALIESYENNGSLVADKDKVVNARKELEVIEEKINKLKTQKKGTVDENIAIINNKITALQNKIYERQDELRAENNKAKDLGLKSDKVGFLTEKKNSLYELKYDKLALESSISKVSNDIEKLENNRVSKRSQLDDANDKKILLIESYNNLNNLESTGVEYSCPECGSIFDVSKTKEYKDAEALKINTKGKELKEKINGLTEGIEMLEDSMELASQSLLKLQADKTQLNNNIDALVKDIAELEKEVANQKLLVPELDLLNDEEIKGYKHEAVELAKQKETLKSNSQQAVIDIDNQINELESQKEPFNQIVSAETTAKSYRDNANLERKNLSKIQDELQLQNDIVILIKELEKEMYERLDKKVSNIFGENVQFKLYKLNVSNGEYDTRMCEIYVKDIENRFVNIKTINTGMYPVRATEIISKIKENYKIPKSFIFIDEMSGLDQKHLEMLKVFNEQILATKVSQNEVIKETIF